jgi:putative ABC transport system permease protein
MYKNHFKIAWRNISRHKGYAIINILGLSLGICASLIIYLITSFELGYDSFHPDKDRIYRLVAVQEDNLGKKEGSGVMIPPLPLILREELTGFETVAEFHHYYARVTIPQAGGEPRRFDAARSGEELSPVIIAEPQYFDLFKYRWLAGNPSLAMTAPFKVVLSEQEAYKYFGRMPPEKMIGKDLFYGDVWRMDSLHVTVSGIVKDWDKNTDLAFKDFISSASIGHSFLKEEIQLEHWGNWSPTTQGFVKLAKGVTPEQVEKQFPQFLTRHVPPYPGHTTELRLQPLSDLHFNSFYRDQYPRKAHLPTLYALMGIAAFILIIAAINFINLSTAQSLYRAKEIGLRKVLGSGKASLRMQFLVETGVITAMAVLLSIGLAYPLLSFLGPLIPTGVALHLLDPSVLLFLVLLTLVTALMAGFYPARVLAAYQPVISLKGQGSVELSHKSRLRKALIVFQFTIALIFIISSFVVGGQIHFILNKDLGFTKDAIITIYTPWNDPVDRVAAFAQRVRQSAAVQDVSVNMETPAASRHAGTWLMRLDAPQFKPEASYEMCDEHYVNVYGLTILAGRNIAHSDTVRDFLINETCAKALGFKTPEDALGRLVRSGMNDASGFIVGVVKDFHAKSLHEPIRPFFISSDRDFQRAVSIKLASRDHSSDNFTTAFTQLEKIWKELYPAEKFEYHFFDQTIAHMYANEQKTAKLINIVMVVAIFISCMGLFGLAAFTARQRAKEIAIRKTLGASAAGIFSLLSKDFVYLVGIAVIIASPIAWYCMQTWLEDFAYRITVSGWIFLAAAVVAIVIALLAISYQALKAAFANPINALRSF